MNAIVQDPETPTAVRVNAVRTKNEIRRTVDRILGLDVDRHWHLHATHQNAKSTLAPVQAGPVNIIFEPYDGPMDPTFVPGHKISKPIDVEADHIEDR